MAVTWNPLDKGSAVTLSNGNLTMASSTGFTNGNVRANKGVSSGKWYWEIKVISGTAVMIGIGNINASLITQDWNAGNNARMYYASIGNKYPGALAYGATYAVNDVIGIALDMDAGTLTFYKNGISQGVAFTDIKSAVGTTIYPYQSSGSGGIAYSITANFGATAFAYNIPDGYAALSESPEPGHQPISALPISAKIKYGSYQVETSTTLPIIWKIIDKNHTGYQANSVTLLTDKMIDLRGFDAKEPLNADANRVSFGNNRYRTSNLRQWLNSGGAANAWWAAQNLADFVLNTNNHDATPADAGMNMPTGYNDIQGFMNNFTAQELTKMLDTTFTVAKNIVTDGGASEIVIDKVFILSTTEVGLANENAIAEGSLFSIFTTNASRVAYMTDQGFANTLSTSKPTTVGTGWHWGLRTPYTGVTHIIRTINRDGSLIDGGSYNGYVGVRPALNLASDILVSGEVDADGCYTVVWIEPVTETSQAYCFVV